MERSKMARGRVCSILRLHQDQSDLPTAYSLNVFRTGPSNYPIANVAALSKRFYVSGSRATTCRRRSSAMSEKNPSSTVLGDGFGLHCLDFLVYLLVVLALLRHPETLHALFDFGHEALEVVVIPVKSMSVQKPYMHDRANIDISKKKPPRTCQPA